MPSLWRPNTTAAIAFEIADGAIPEFTLWQRDAYDAKKDYFSFFRGALLGVSVLLALALFALYGFRSRAVFPVAGGFAVASIAFMMFEAGHLPSIIEAASLQGLDLQSARAVIEGAMAAFLLLLLATLSELQRIWRLAGNLLLVLGGLAFAIPIYGFAEPLLATTIARGLFAATAVGGFLLIFILWRRQEAKAETALVSWGAILLWTFLAAVAALSGDGSPMLSVIVLAGLCAVLIVLGFTLAHYAFSQGFLSRNFFREAGRHALALAGARAYVWDWQTEDGELYVSPEIERALAQPPGLFAEAGAEAFLELMHPTDRSRLSRRHRGGGLRRRVRRSRRNSACAMPMAAIAGSNSAPGPSPAMASAPCAASALWPTSPTPRSPRNACCRMPSTMS